MTKSEVSKEFARLRPLGFQVWNFNFKGSLPSGMKDFVDFVITNGKYVVFAEIKIGKDVLSEGQKATGAYLSHASIYNKCMHYKVITDMKSVKLLTDNLLSGKL
jgi:hypothetical protein